MTDGPIPGSEERLARLLAQRMEPGADVKAIDETVWSELGQTWAVMFTDLTGFSRLVAEFGIIHFLQEIHEQRTLFVPLVAEHGGLLLKEEADSMLLIFPRTAQAIACAIAMNRRSYEANLDRADEDKVLLCAGIGFGRMLRVGERDVFGQEVNAASKLGEDTAKANEILVTDAARLEAGALAGITYTRIETKVAGSAVNWKLGYAIEP